MSYPDSHAQEADVGELLLHVCHDLRTALRGITAHTDLLLRDNAGAAGRDFEQRLGFVRDGARKIELLTEGLSGYSIALQIREDTFQAVPMNVLLRTVLARLKNEIAEAGAEVNYEDLPRIRGDADRLMELLEHLVRNALRHRGEAAPRIHVRAESQPGIWLFCLTDNGPGIESAFLEKIFRPFVRLQGKQKPGPGLGLTTCRVIVEKHGGRIWAEPNEGGAHFRFILPAA